MIVEPIRMGAKAMSDVTLGVNAQIDALTLGQTAAGVNDVRPVHVVTVKNQADHNIEVREADNESQYPLIVVLTRSDGAGQGQRFSGTQDFELEVEFCLVTRGGTSALNTLNTDYYLRAMKKAVNTYLLASNTRDTNGRLNNIAIKSAKRITLGHAQGSLLGGQVAGVMKVTFELRDLTP